MVEMMDKKKIRKGDYGYIKKRKLVQMAKVAFVLLDIIIVMLIGIYISGSRKNLLTIVAVLMVLPMANFAASLITLFPHKSAPLKEYEEFQKHSGGLITSCDMVITSRTLVVPLEFAVVHSSGVYAYSASKDLKVKDAQEYVENMCAANQLNTKVHIFKDLGPFYRRLDALEREKPDGEKEDELLHIKACMLAISL